MSNPSFRGLQISCLLRLLMIELKLVTIGELKKRIERRRAAGF